MPRRRGAGVRVSALLLGVCLLLAGRLSNGHTDGNTKHNSVSRRVSEAHRELAWSNETSCSDIDTCSECAETSLCHWCEDYECHVYGSPYAPLSCNAGGVYCYNNDVCHREAPEWKGQKGATASVIFATLFVCLVVMICGGCCLMGCSEWVRYNSEETERRDPNFVPMRDMDSDGGYIRTTRSGSLPEIDPWDPAPRVKETRTHPVVARCHRLGTRCCGCCLLTMWAVAICLMVYAPRYPEFDFCNTDADWGSIITGMETMSTRLDVQLLISVWNPNVLDLRVTSGQAIFKWGTSKEIIGVSTFPVFEADGGFVSDALVTVSFTPKATDVLTIITEYEENALALFVSVELYGEVLYHGESVGPLPQYSLTDYYIVVGETGDRSLCNCQDW